MQKILNNDCIISEMNEINLLHSMLTSHGERELMRLIDESQGEQSRTELALSLATALGLLKSVNPHSNFLREKILKMCVWSLVNPNDCSLSIYLSLRGLNHSFIKQMVISTFT